MSNMFVPDIRPILEAQKQAQELCKSGVLKTIAHHCPRGHAPTNRAAAYFQLSIAAISVLCIFGSLCLLFIAAIWMYHIYYQRTGDRNTPKLEVIHVRSDDNREERCQPVFLEVRTRK
jgi:hypothetical protein